jgi:hypothetical protein
MNNSQIQSILEMLGKRVPASSRLFLLGGSALILLGSQRPTIDIDFIGDDVSPSEFDRAIMHAAKELKIFIEPVPIERFIPLPAGSDRRKIRIGKYGNMEVYVTDPYSIAISKLDRGFDTDFDDILFLVQNNHVELKELERMAQVVLTRAREFDIDPADFLAHLDIVRERLK